MAQASNRGDKVALTALDLPVPQRQELPEHQQRYFDKCEDKLGLIPNVLTAYSHNPGQLDAFSRFYNELMLGESGLSPLEREMIAVVVSACNRCYYCLTAHGAAVREYSGSPELGEQLVMNYRVANLPARQRAMLDFAVQLTETPDRIEEADREQLRAVGFSDTDIWDIAGLAGFYNMTNRLAAAVELQPNPEYHARHRGRTAIDLQPSKP